MGQTEMAGLTITIGTTQTALTDLAELTKGLLVDNRIHEQDTCTHCS